MTTTYPLATLAPTVGPSGISIPSYNDVYQSLTASFQQIFGSDIYIAADSQDGQWIGVLAQAITDSNNAAVAVFNSFSPTYAQGTQLSSLVKINGLARNVPSNSTAVGTVIGVAGTIIANGTVQDSAGNLWNLPANVVIPVGGSITVTVTALNPGSVTAPIGTINIIYNPQYGWQSFSNTGAATAGLPLESDPALKGRQSVSTATNAVGILESIYTAIINVPGVNRCMVYQNDTAVTDTNGVPAHTISAVVDGGTVASVALAIATKKAPGGQTYGTTTQTVYDQYGLPTTVNYFVLTYVPIYFNVTIKALPGYISTTGTALETALAAFVTALAIGESVYVSQAQAAAGLIGLPQGQTFYITAFTLGTTASPSGTSNIALLFNQAASCSVANINLTVT